MFPLNHWGRETVGSVVVLAVVLVALILVSMRFMAPVSPIDTNVMALVPREAHDPVLAAAIDRVSQVVAGRVTLLLQHPEGVPPGAAADLAASLAATGHYLPLDDEAGALWRWLFTHRGQLLCPDDLATLKSNGGAALAREALARIHAPLLPLPAELLRTDPLLLTLRLVDCFTPLGHTSDGAILLAGRLTGSAFALDVQDQLAATILAWQERHVGDGISLSRAGAVFHATDGAASARAEILRVGTVSLGVTLLVFLALFASLRAALLAGVAILIGILGGLAACLIVFSKVHALALLFGAAMTGIGVDYAIHVMVAGLARGGDAGQKDNPARLIARPLSIGLITTLAALGCLLVGGIELMRQVAVFGTAGLLLSFGFSRFVLWRLYRPPGRIGAAAALARQLARGLLGWTVGWRLLAPAALVLSVVAWGGWRQVEPADDIRSFQEPSAELLAEERAVTQATGLAAEPRFLLVRATTREALATAEASAVALLDQPLPAPAWLDPSAQRQAFNRHLLEQRLWSTELEMIAGSLGLDPAGLYPARADDAPPATLPAPLDQLRGDAAGQAFSIVPLAPADADRIARLPLPPGVELVDPAAVFSQLLELLRGQVTMALTLAFGAGALLLLAIHRRWSSLTLLLPAGIALAVVPALASFTGQGVSLFSVMGLLLAFGLGIDYAAFLAIDRPPSAAVSTPEQSWREAGILAAAITSITPMAALAFSATLPVAHFGFAVALGAALCLFLLPLARVRSLEE